MTTQKNLYDSDFYAWCQYQASALRENQFSHLDIANLTEEIESMGRKEKSELINRLAIALAHILKWIYQPARQCKSWQHTIDEQIDRVHDLLKENPSLKPKINECVEQSYKYARRKAAAETGIELNKFPEEITSEIIQQLWEKN